MQKATGNSIFHFKKIRVSIKIILIICCLSCFCYGQTGSHIQVNGRNLTGTCGDTLVLKGVNYAPYNWGYTASENYFEQIALTKANAVRIVWFKNSTSAIYNNLVYLDSALARCVRAKMIPIVELHDATCTGNMNDVVALVPFYTSSAFKALELKYRQHLIINIANEAGYYAWTSNQATALNTYKTTYINALHTLRNSGLQVPVMIDAPDCGTNSDAFVNAGAEILASDVLSNTLFSVHGYWYGFAGNNPTTMLIKVQALYNSGLCIYFGEIANQQDDTSPCQYNLAYVQLLNILKTYNIGWSAWGWYHDVCTQRQLSNNGNANNLSAYGQVIVNDPVVGLKATAIQPLQFKTNCGDTCTLTSAEIIGPAKACLNIGTGTPVKYSIASVANAVTYQWTLPANSTLVSASPDLLSVFILLNTGFASGTNTQKRILVKSISACGNTAESYLSISTSLPTTPVFLTGPINPCTNIASGSDAIYTVRKVPIAISYNWSAFNNTSGGAGSITISGHPGGTGANDTIVTVHFNTGYRSGNIKVQSVGDCGTSLQKSLTITAKKVETPAIIEGNATPCIGTTEVYSCTLVANSSGYKWSVPLNAKIINGQGTNQISVLFPANNQLFKPGNISVMALSLCGNSGKKSLAITKCIELFTKTKLPY